MDKKLQQQAFDWADKVLKAWDDARSSPTKALAGESLAAYERLDEWDWFDNFPVDDPHNRRIVRLILAMNKYGKLKWAKDHPKKKKPSKWERVTGVSRRLKDRI